MANRILNALCIFSFLVLMATPCSAQTKDFPFKGSESLPPRALSTSGPTRPAELNTAEPASLKTLLSSTVISDVSAYLWWDGCGPTAVGMVVGYYDTCGYPDLVPGDAMTDLPTVRQMIASHGSPSNPQHYEDYSEPIDSYGNIKSDKSELPTGDEHTSNCLADFMHTSWSREGLPYGWGYSDMISVGWLQYVNLVTSNYQATAENYWPSKPITWSLLLTEINNNRPMVFLVDTNSDGSTDHFVTVIGYGEDGTSQYYGFLDTWDTQIHWQKFQAIASGRPWGIWGGTRFAIQDVSTPTPTNTPLATPTPLHTGMSPTLWDFD